MIPVGDTHTWRNRLAMATDDELATLDQQIGPTHALRPLISEEVMGRAHRRAGVGAEFEPVQIPMTAAVVTPPAVPDIAVPPVPAANPNAAQAGLPQPVPAFYNEGDRQLVRDTSNTMDRMGAVAPQVIGEYRQAAADVVAPYVDAASSLYQEWAPRISQAASDTFSDIGSAVSSGYARHTQTGFPEPAPNSMLGAQTGGNSAQTSPGMMGAQVGPQAQPLRPPTPVSYPPPGDNSMLGKQINPNTPTTAPGFQGALIGPQGTPTPPFASAAATPVPGGPPPPPSPLSQVTAVPAPRRKPDIPVMSPPQQTTKSANPQGDPSAAEALNRFYAGQYSQGRMPGAPATVEDARTMASMGDFKGAWR